MKNRLFWGGGAFVIIATGAVGLIGFAHTPAGLPLLPYVQAIFGQPKSCPLGMDGATSSPEVVARAYAKSSGQLGPAAAKFVPDFAFGRTTAGELNDFASDHGGRCHATKGSTEFECTDVRTQHGTQTLWASFGEHDGLLRLKSVESIPRATDASRRYAALNASIERGAGAPIRRTGSHGVTDLKSGLLYQASREYQFQNYMATVRVTNLGKTFAITTHYYDPEVR